jgi:hypothetical protein
MTMKTLTCPKCFAPVPFLEAENASEKFGVGDSLAMDTGTGPLKDRLTCEDIVNRAAAREAFLNKRMAVWSVVALVVMLMAFWQPVHAWLHVHLELLLGILIGTLAQSIAWLIDRWRWLRWFSR